MSEDKEEDAQNEFTKSPITPRTTRKCPECGSERLIRDYETAEIVCMQCGYVLADKIADRGPEWRAFDNEQRAKRTRVGAPLTFSVDYNEPVMIRDEKGVRIPKIGEFVDELLPVGAERIGDVELARVKGYFAVSFDSDYRIDFQPIQYVARHHLHEDLYELTLEGKRKVRVTGAHSVFTVKGSEVVPIKVSDLKKGNFVVAPKSIPTPEGSEFTIDLIKEFLKLHSQSLIAIKIASKYNDQKLMKLANAPFLYLRITGIRRVKPTTQYAYDLSVPTSENFLGGTGGIFLHNSIHDKGLSTMIDWHDRDTYGKNLSPGQRAQVYRLRKWQRRVRVSDATERNLAFALSELSKMSSTLNLPKNILETASVIYRKAVKRRLIRGRSIQGVTAAALYMACRQCGVARTLDEIAHVSAVNKKEIGRSYRFMVKELDTFVPPSTPRYYVSRFANQLGLAGRVETVSLRILRTAKTMRLTSGRGPTGIAAAATYIASVLAGERRTQREIAEIANVTEVTIRNRYKELIERLDILVKL